MKSNILIFLLLISIIGACEIIPEGDSYFTNDVCLTKAISPCHLDDDSIQPTGVIPERLIKLYVKYYIDPQEISNISPYVFEDDTLFYILNLHKGGWKIISGNSKTSPILAECGNGAIDLDNPDIPVQIMLNDAKNTMLSLSSSKKTKDLETSRIWNILQSIDTRMFSKRNPDRSTDDHWIQVLVSTSSSTVDYENVYHLISTTWDQDSIWNIKAPISGGCHCLAGCVSVALAQLFYYYHHEYGYPNRLYHSVSVNNNPNIYPLRDQIILLDSVQLSTRWNYMRLTRNSSGNYEYVADLLAYIGKTISTDYGLSLSSANFDVQFLHDFDLTCNKYEANSCDFSTTVLDSVFNYLRASKPLMVTNRATQVDQVGHAWIIDGFSIKQETVSTTYQFYYVDDPYALNGTYNGYSIVGIYSDDEMASLYPNYMNGFQTIDNNVLYHKFFRMNWGLNNGNYDNILQDLQNWYYGDTCYSNGIKSIYYNIRRNN